MINNIWIIKDTGQNLFYRSFGSAMMDENLISGLFVALNSFAKESGKGSIDSLILKDEKFIYMNFGPIFVVIGCDRSDEIDAMKEIMNSIGTKFIAAYGKSLENWDGNVIIFRPFSDVLDNEFKPKPPITIPTPQLLKNEMISQEIKELCAEFTCETVKDENSNVNVFLSRNLDQHYIININFKNYPEKPKINFPKELKKILGKPEEALLTVANWNPKSPPKIVEIMRELETYLIQSTTIDRYLNIIVDKG